MLNAMAILGNLGTWEILIIVLVIVLLFGSAKIPQLMRGMGSGINEFKKGLKEGEKDAAKEEAKEKEAPKAESKPADAEKK
jgi:sec-independent protein translocase protein TatA